MTEYRFTENWLHIYNLKVLKEIILEKENGINILELGTYEGRSAFYMLDNYCIHKDSKITTIDFRKMENLEYNIKLRDSEKFIFINDNFHNVIPKLMVNNNKYDLIYIDGGKDSRITIFQIVNCWELLNKDGILYLDDYEWGKNEVIRPKEAIDFFLNTFKENYKIIFKNYQVALIKK